MMNMTHALRPALLALAVLLAGCSSVPKADRIVYSTTEPPGRPLAPAETWNRGEPPPVDDISEEERREWFRNNAPPPRRVKHPSQGRRVYRDRPVYVRERSWWEGPELFHLVLAGAVTYWAKRHWDHHHDW